MLEPQPQPGNTRTVDTWSGAEAIVIPASRTGAQHKRLGRRQERAVCHTHKQQQQATHTRGETATRAVPQILIRSST
jgi:hypothetical protein